MKTKYRFMGLLGSLVCFGAGGYAYADTESIPDELLEDPPAIMKQELPDIFSGLGSEFAMKFVPPEPNIDFKIGKVAPDPEIDYKIRITNPRSRDSLMGLNDLRGRIPRRNTR